MKVPRPSPEPTVEVIERRLAHFRKVAGAHRSDPKVYAADHVKLNDLLDAWEQARPVPYG